jgi:23S rRNA pseudouridine2605 synthase
VPKTYVVKVSGVPTEEKIEELRSGVLIREDNRKPVRTAPAKISMIKQADNPWYEITLIEGRNRQIRKMFEAVGHHVEKIRRVKYGPLHLDVEPGKLRPLDAREVEALRAAAEGRRPKPAGIKRSAPASSRQSRRKPPVSKKKQF